MKYFFYLLMLLLPEFISGQAFVDPCGSGLKPFDHSQQILFDSCFSLASTTPAKSCTIEIQDDMFTRKNKEEIQVTLDEKGRAVKLAHFMHGAEKIACAEITCSYQGEIFYSTHIRGADTARTYKYRSYITTDKKYREDSFWYQSDTTERADTKMCYFRNNIGKDSCIKVYTKSDGKTFQFLQDVKMTSDSTEERNYMVVFYRFSTSTPDTSNMRKTITYNKRKQIVRREHYSSKTKGTYIWNYWYNSSGKLIGFRYLDAYGKDEGFAIQRDKKNMPIEIKCYGFMYSTTYKLTWSQ